MAEHLLPDPVGFPVRLRTASPDQTRSFAARAADLLRGGEALLLHGPLGAGKTCFVQALCVALGVTDEVTSPTFTLANRYEGRLVVHHLDFYRLGPEADLADVGVETVLDEVEGGEAVLVAEWPERLAPLLKSRLEFLVLPGAAPEDRLWHLRGIPALPDPWTVLAAGFGGARC